MVAEDLASQEFMRSTLSQRILGHAVLFTHCPLDYGKHDCSPTTGTGIFDKLPEEIKEKVLENIDVQSLLVFRRVNKEAMAVVNGTVKWRKVSSI